MYDQRSCKLPCLLPCQTICLTLQLQFYCTPLNLISAAGVGLIAVPLLNYVPHVERSEISAAVMRPGRLCMAQPDGPWHRAQPDVVKHLHNLCKPVILAAQASSYPTSLLVEPNFFVPPFHCRLIKGADQIIRGLKSVKFLQLPIFAVVQGVACMWPAASLQSS